ncbi:MAG: RluA family pseudouridine synthase [Candidatus Marinimicrobia bacterium]|nr:RluA family pseudouridine synthase [Candidatus Neomarinimicrobiota bacterium]
MTVEQLNILFEDNHLLVVCKPPGLLVQGDRTGDRTLLDIARNYIKETYAKPGNVYLGLVHRLDRPASGVMVFAKTSKAAGRLMKQFRQRTVRKIYHCLAEGEIPESGQWQDRIGRREATGVIVKGEPNASLAFKRLAFSNGISLAEVELHTGKHHQIRVQFAGRGFPLVGDFRYGSKIKFPERAIALHARKLSFEHPTTKERLTFKCEPDSAWKSYV